MKTRVEVRRDYEHGFCVGTSGYIDGYIRGCDKIPYAVVVFGDVIDLVPIKSLKVIEITTK